MFICSQAKLWRYKTIYVNITGTFREKMRGKAIESFKGKTYRERLTNTRNQCHSEDNDKSKQYEKGDYEPTYKD